MVKIEENHHNKIIEQDMKEQTIIQLQDIKLGSSVKESYKTLRTNLLYTEATKTIAITSTLPNEGKSVTAYHLAVSFASAGKKTLLIDCDLRKSKLYRYLHVSRELPGLSEYLSRQMGMNIYQTTFPDLFLMFSGKIPPNPTELLSNELFELMLYKWKEEFDYVILDTPPVNSAVDASIVGRYVDGIVYVVRSDYVKRKFVEKSKKMIQRNGGHIVGVVLNRLDQYHANYYGYYGETE
ncbi:CpsD/CapB family tyrosine-protein kinase [[Eubacterium] hominis]|uniref:CpsD/CapB family tyrosine-protein kinase n=1 Tax=[Eubacterium] hominis TaxID=2764325 RepID=UPI003A4DEEBD